MGIEPFLIASTVRAVVGQRLVRRLCVNCRESFSPNEVDLKQLTKTFGLDKAEIIKKIHAYEVEAQKGNIGKNIKDLGSTESKITTLYKAHDDGCAACNHTGYKGRIGIYEVLQNSETVQTLIVSNATSDKIQTAAIDEGMLTMQLDGLVKALRGETTIEEILRVTAEA
jgi:type II secretory ATPase GspE/PulE/Tfp pilus assembly ATPase PilB-like protein